MYAKFSERLSSLSKGDISATIQMAWEDRTAFETIQERMKGRMTKHRALRNVVMKFEDRLAADQCSANCLIYEII